MICARRKEVTSRLTPTRPRGSVIGITTSIEETALQELRRLEPPIALETHSRAAIALWSRRVTLLEDARQRSADLSDEELSAQLAEVNRLTEQLNHQLRELGVPECVLGS
jgi:hypothetical protein